MAKIRNVTNEFLQVNFFIRIPLIPIGIMLGTIYFETDSYGKSTKLDKKFCNYDWKKVLRIVNIKKLYKSYDTCYLRFLNDNKPLKSGIFNDKYISKSEFYSVFRDF